MSTFSAIKQDLSYLLNEQAVPTTGVGNRTRFINVSIADIINRKHWEWNRTTATVMTNALGLATLPSNCRQEGVLDVRVVRTTGVHDDDKFEEVTYEDFDDYSTADDVYHLQGAASAGDYALKTNLAASTTLTVRYSKKPVTLSVDADVVNIPDDNMVIAKGALFHFRLAEDPQADVGVEEQQFEKALRQLYEMENRNKPIRRFKGLAERKGYRGPGAY